MCTLIPRLPRPRVRRTPLLVIVGILCLLVSLAGTASNGAAMASAFGASKDSSILANIPIEPDTAAHVVQGWSGVHATTAGTSFISAMVNDVPARIVDEFTQARIINAMTYLIVMLIGLFASLLLLTGRLRRRWLPAAAFAGGAVIAIGSTIAQVSDKSATENLSVFVQSSLGHWTEPGFGVGLDLTPVILGLAIAATSILFMMAGRFARDTDGMV